MEHIKTHWRKSSYSGGNGGACIEVADAPGKVLIRDSKDPDGSRLAFGRHAWATFTGKLKADA